MARKCPVCKKEVKNKNILKNFPQYMYCNYCKQNVFIGEITGRKK